MLQQKTMNTFFKIHTELAHRSVICDYVTFKVKAINW